MGWIKSKIIMANYSTSNLRNISNYFAAWNDGNKIPLNKVINNLSATYYPNVTPASTTTYYFMRGQDLDCLPTITYRYWTVTDVPDTSALQYSGTRCGVTPLAGVGWIAKVIV